MTEIYEDVPDKVDDIRAWHKEIVKKWGPALKEHSRDTQSRKRFDGLKRLQGLWKDGLQPRLLKTNEPEYVRFVWEGFNELMSKEDHIDLTFAGDGGRADHYADLILEAYMKATERYPDD